MTDTTIQSDAETRARAMAVAAIVTALHLAGGGAGEIVAVCLAVGITRNDVINAMNTARRMDGTVEKVR